MKTICIMCPLGCPLDIQDQNGEIAVNGNTCKRGEVYGKQEYTSPKRVVTSLVKVEGHGVTSVKTDNLIDKEIIFDILNELKKIKLQAPVKVGQVVIENILNTGVNIVATREIN